MSDFEGLARVNVETADAIAANEGSFDDLAAELLLRNIAVITDRLDPEAFASLPFDAEWATMDAASSAQALAPLDPADTERLPHESNAEYNYRVSVWHPLHSLQAKVAGRDFDKSNPDEVTKLRAAVRLGSTAFAAILAASEENPTVVETERYFWGNTNAAAGRVARSQVS